MMGSREDWIRSQCSGSVLDIGSATGWVFRGSGLDVTSLDINEFPPGEFPRIVADAHNLPLDDESFDCCVLAECLEHVNNPILVLKEAARVASKKVIFTVPDEYNWTPNHLPLRTIDDTVREKQQSPEQLFKAGNPDCIKLNDIKQAFHNRWYTKEMLESHLSYLGLPYQIQTIAYDGWSWFGGTITKKAAPENIFDRPEYWCGNLGYRPTPDGIGYQDFPIHQVIVSYILSRKPKGKVLDIGCAFGYIVKRLRDKEVDAFGIDISQYALSQAPKDVKPYLKHGSADSLPWPDEYFDMVVTFSVMEHLDLEVLPKAISEIKRVARRGIISVTPGDTPYFNEDITHKTKQPLSWWRNQFPPEFEVRSNANEEWTKVVPSMPSIYNVKYETRAQPRSLHIDIFPFCNAKCLFCRYHTLTRARAKMERKLLEHILDDAASWPEPLQEIVPVHYGEFFLDPDWYETLKLIETKLPQTGIVIPTNGSMLDQVAVEKLATIKTLSMVDFSVNAFFQETYQELMGLGPENIPRIKQAISQLNALRPSVRTWVSMVYSPNYQSEREKDLFSEEWRHYTSAVFIQATRYCHDYFRPVIKSKMPCQSVFIDSVILSDGRVCPCCFDSDGTIIVGDVTQERILDIWHGARMNNLRQLHNSGRRDEVPLCSECTFS